MLKFTDYNPRTAKLKNLGIGLHLTQNKKRCTGKLNLWFISHIKLIKIAGK